MYWKFYSVFLLYISEIFSRLKIPTKNAQAFNPMKGRSNTSLRPKIRALALVENYQCNAYHRIFFSVFWHQVCNWYVRSPCLVTPSSGPNNLWQVHMFVFLILIVVPQCRTNINIFSISFQGPKFFNSFSFEIRNATSTSTASLCCKLKAFLLS